VVMIGAENTKQDLLKKVERLSKEIMQCQNFMEAGRPCYGPPDTHTQWLSKLQAELAETETQLAELGD